MKNFKFIGDEIPFLGDALTLGRDEALLIQDGEMEQLMPNSCMIKRLEKIEQIMDAWYFKANYFPTID